MVCVKSKSETRLGLTQQKYQRDIEQKAGWTDMTAFRRQIYHMLTTTFTVAVRPVCQHFNTHKKSRNELQV